ncbi:MAG TPA: metal-dependent hydrolase [Chitinophagaceae bacterium]|nr:metal-dependent hydrolase [Chitinophagaceae bacterium]
MFIGHYAVGFIGKKIDKRPSLGTLFLAVQWLDLIWPLLVFAGIERFSIQPGNTRLTPLNFEFYPWSHSMLMALVWAVLFGLIYGIISKNRKGAILLFILVFSHWVLDWLTHRPDLQLSPFSEMRVGLGLWNHAVTEIVLETALFVAGIYFYISVTKTINKAGQWAFWALVIFLLLIHFMNLLGPPPPDSNTVAWMALSQWLLVGWGYWIDRNRIEKKKAAP